MRKLFSFMTMIMLVMVLLMIPMVCMAQAADPGGLSIDLTDFLTTITSLTLVAWFLTELIGSLIARWIQVSGEHKKIIAIVLTLVLGLGARYTGLSFMEIPLLQFVVALVVAAAGAGVINDKVAKPLHLQIPARKYQ